MLARLKKAWRATFYPDLYLGDRPWTYFDGMREPSFLYYFLEIPTENSSILYELVYFVFFGFILFPLKNLIKALVEFPVTFLSSIVWELSEYFSNRTLINGLLTYLAFMLSLLRYSISFLLSPTFMRCRIQSITENEMLSNGTYFINHRVIFVFIRLFLETLILASENPIRTILVFLSPLTSIFYYANSLSSVLRAEPASQDPLRNPEYLKFKQFQNFNPNVTLSAISGRALGFNENSTNVLENTVVQYQETNLIKHALLPEVWGHHLKRAPGSYHQVPRSNLLSNLNNACPEKKYLFIPPKLAEKFTLKLRCPLLFETFERLDVEHETITRTIYGHYFTKNNLLTWLARNNNCPLTRLPLTLDDISDVPLDIIETEKTLLLRRQQIKELDEVRKKTFRHIKKTLSPEQHMTDFFKISSVKELPVIKEKPLRKETMTKTFHRSYSI